MITDETLREQIGDYCRTYNYSDGQIKLILRLMRPEQIGEVNEGAADFSNELLDVLDSFESAIGQPPEIEIAYRGETESERAARTPRTHSPGVGKINGRKYSSGPSYEQGKARAARRKHQGGILPPVMGTYKME